MQTLNEHVANTSWRQRPAVITVIGCGGTGAQIAMGLPYLHQALLAIGHPFGLRVFLADGDTISETNCVRQPFARSEVGLYKTVVLINRLNLFWGFDWEALPHHVTCGRDLPDSDFLISCVDTRVARADIARIAPEIEAVQLLAGLREPGGPGAVCARSAAVQGPKGQGRALALCE